MSRPRGALALVLHSHMPYVEGFDSWPFGEEWLWEAVATVYLPLLDVLDGAPVTLGVTPVLCDQLETLPGQAGERCQALLRDVRAVVHERDSAALERAGEREAAAELRRAADDYVRAADTLDGLGRDLLAAIRGLDRVELWTSAASHPILPLLATDAGLRLQLGTGIASHERRFGSFGGGLWLPECAYAPGLERHLHDHGVRAFCVDATTAHGYGTPAQLEPVATETGPVAVPIDWATVELVWGERAGYPTDASYRDYHRRTLYDLHPWANGGGVYRHAEARARAAEHAHHFVGRVIERLDAYAADSGRPGLVTCAVDTELLGHWWYEGPIWLAAVLREAAAQGLRLVTASEGLELVEPVERALGTSSWGAGKDLSTWDAPPVADMAFAARAAELRTVAAAATRHAPPAALERAARELLALQASDWAFLATRELAGDYPRRRIAAHTAAHEAALAALHGDRPAPEGRLRALAPDLDAAALVAP
ncbi:MAG: 1,4-alpha-glucan branching protein domain-containing protein [Nocardioidaceae bacterium]